MRGKRQVFLPPEGRWQPGENACVDPSPACAEAVTDVSMRMLDAVRGRIGRKLRGLIDAEDVSQDVWAVLVQKGPLAGWLGSSAGLAALAVKIARDRLIHLRRHHLGTRKAGRYREVGLGGRGARGQGPPQAQQPDPTGPVAVEDCREALLRQASARERAVFALLCDGCTHPQIAATLGLSPKTVQRAVVQLRRHARALFDLGPSQ